jgi:hypothetical protein
MKLIELSMWSIMYCFHHFIPHIDLNAQYICCFLPSGLLSSLVQIDLDIFQFFFQLVSDKEV